MSTSYEAPHYATFSIIPLLHPSFKTKHNYVNYQTEKTITQTSEFPLRIFILTIIYNFHCTFISTGTGIVDGLWGWSLVEHGVSQGSSVLAMKRGYLLWHEQSVADK
jgi:hypothetical protein